MNRKQKDNLIKAFEELNAPDKDVLLQKIESKKALGGEFVEQKSKAEIKTAHKKRAVWTSLACSLVVIVIAIIILSQSVFQPSYTPDGSPNAGTDIIDYQSEWRFASDDRICFDTIDKTMQEAGVDLIYDYNQEWRIVETQITQDESGYREYYSKDGKTVEVTVLLEQRFTSKEGKYFAIFRNINGSFIHGKYRVYRSYYFDNDSRKEVYVIYLKNQVYIFTLDVDLRNS